MGRTIAARAGGSVPKTCRCGNTQGEPLVSPAPVSYVDVTQGRKTVHLLFMGGFVGDQCWFCARPVLSDENFLAARP